MKMQFAHLIFMSITIISCSKNDKSVLTDPSKEKKWMVTTIAGNGTAYFKDGPALMAGFHAPQDVAVTANGSIYVADAINHRIRKINNDFVISYAGSGVDDTTSGVGTSASFAFPVQINADPNGNLYTLDVEDFRIRK